MRVKRDLIVKDLYEVPEMFTIICNERSNLDFESFCFWKNGKVCWTHWDVGGMGNLI